MIQEFKTQIKDIEKEIDFLCDKYKKIQDSRVKEGLSLAIYKCEDPMAKILVDLNKLIDDKCAEIDLLKKKIKKIEVEELKKNCIAAHEKIKGRYLIKIPYLEDVYVDNKEDFNDYILKCRENEINLSIAEYIDYNNSLDRTVNRPYLYPILSLDFDKDLEVTTVPHQGNCEPYFNEIKRISSGKVVDRRIRGYNSSNDSIFYIYMFNDYNHICFHEPYSKEGCMIISRREKEDFLVENGKNINFGTKRVKVLSAEQREFVKKIINHLSKCKDYKYDIELIEKLME